MTTVAAMTRPTDGATATAGHLPAALLTDGAGEATESERHAPDLKVASHSVAARDESLDTTRAFVRRTMRAWRIDGLTEDLALVVTELVTNALRHGVSSRGPAANVDVALYGTDSRLMCAVSDPSDEVPVRMTPDLARSSGRGLQIVEALSMYWGWTSMQGDDGPHGKSVWAVFTLDGLHAEPARAG